jgi:hypothetical protein
MFELGWLQPLSLDTSKLQHSQNLKSAVEIYQTFYLLASKIWHHSSCLGLLYPLHDILPNLLSPSKPNADRAKVPQLATACD